MITKKQVKQRVRELIKKSLNGKRLDKMVDSIIKNTYIDLKEEEDNYRLPKNIVCAISKQLHFDYQPLHDDRKQKKEIERYYCNIWNC